MDKTPNNNLSSDEQIKAAKEKLVRSGYKLTIPRQVLIDILGKYTRLCDADSLYLEIKKDHPEIGIATIYRNLDLFTRLRIICSIIFGSGKVYYLLSKDCYKETFIYMICNNCKKIITSNKCLNDAIKVRLKEGAEESILKNCNLKIDNYQVLFTGLCEECNED